MQNTSQTFRGSSAPGVNFNDHSFENHLGSHCPPSGYQPYSNPPYHPVPSSRPHHYGSHQMQPNMPYRHHGGAYAPNQNQYAAGMNQEIYRNHHSNYVGSNNRNMPSKPWSDNNSSGDLMTPYGQVTSHPQMMNNPSQLPGSSMRSPPQATSNLNQTASQGQQHYRPMQSPAHSPHSWSQAQIPSPGVMHSSRTTPSPLSAHARSPGHSQPFSPPAAHAMNLQPIPPPPENGQVPQTVNSASDNHNPSNPLHSLQKMVMLDQDPKSNMMPLSSDNNEQFANQCGPYNYGSEEGASNESKDSSYSTYYNMDENRFESKPNNTDADTPVYSSVQQVSNCNFSVTNPVSHEDSKSIPPSPCRSNSTVSEVYHPDQSTVPINKPVSNLEQPQCKANVPQNDCSLQLNECPPHAESAPVFTDQTKAAVSTNSEQALQSSASANWVTDNKANVPNSHLADVPKSDVAGTPDSLSELQTTFAKQSDIPNSPPNSKIKCETIEEVANASNPHENNSQNENFNSIVEKSSSSNPGSDVDSDAIEKSECSDVSQEEKHNPAIVKLSSSSDIPVENAESKSVGVLKEENIEEKECKKPSLRRRKIGASYEEAPSPDHDLKSNVNTETHNSKKLKDVKVDSKKTKFSTVNQNNNELKSEQELSRNPVKVVIHRIRKSDTNDTWHVPGNKSSQEEYESELKNGKTDSKVASTSPQIIMLSNAKTPKKFENQNSTSLDSVVIKQEDTEAVENEVVIIKEENSCAKISSSNFSDKKRGRPVGSKNKFKTNNNHLKKRRNRKGSKKKKIDPSKQKVTEVAGKTKKVKVFSGPYVHLTGSKENPSAISVVNVAQKEEEKINKPCLKRNFGSTTVSRIKKKPVGHLSTLSPTYDAFNRDKTWLCVFCHKGSHHEGLGDLYGPYYIKDKICESDIKNTNSSSSSSSKSKRRKSDAEETKSSKKARQSSGHMSLESTPVGKQSTDIELSESGEPLKEVWIHEDCVVWCQSVSLMGEEVHGLEESIAEAKENICSHCKLDGATVGCWGKGCKEQYHFSCAKENGCQMDIENFSLLCPEHQKKNNAQQHEKKNNDQQRSKCQQK